LKRRSPGKNIHRSRYAVCKDRRPVDLDVHRSRYAKIDVPSILMAKLTPSSKSMTQQQRSVDPLENDQIAEAIRNSGVGNNNLVLHNNDIPPNATVTPSPAQRSVTQQTQAQGDASAGRRIAQLNGVENMRFPDVDVLAITDALQRRTSPILSSVARTSDSRATGPTAMRFARLRQAARPESVLTPRPRLRPQKPERRDHDLSIGPGTTFGIGGDVQQNGSANTCADVGLHSDLPLGIHFED